MNNPLILISLSENDKRLIFALLLIFILILVLIGYLGFLLVKLMKWQGKKMDTLIHDVVVTKVITDKKTLMRYGRKKNYALFFKQSYIPLILIMLGLIVLLIRCSIYNDFAYNIFSTENGFGTLFFTWKFGDQFTGDEFSFIRFHILVTDNEPHFAAEAWASYVCVPLFLIGGVWYLVAASSLFARTIMLEKRSREVFEKSLEGYNQTEADKNKQQEQQEQQK